MNHPRREHTEAAAASQSDSPPHGPPGDAAALLACVARVDRAVRRLLPVLEMSDRPVRPGLWRIALED